MGVRMMKIGEEEVLPIGKVIYENKRYAVSVHNGALLIQQKIVSKFAVLKRNKFGEYIRINTVTRKPKIYMIPNKELEDPIGYLQRIKAPKWVIDTFMSALKVIKSSSS